MPNRAFDGTGRSDLLAGRRQKGSHSLGMAVVKNSEVTAGEIRDGLALAIGNHRIDDHSSRRSSQSRPAGFLLRSDVCARQER